MALSSLGAMLLLLAGAEAPLKVRASEAVAPCVRAAATAWSGRVELEAGSLMAASAADVLVAASGVEMTRAVESGRALDGSEVEIARIPWVISVPRGNPEGVLALKDLARPGVDA